MMIYENGCEVAGVDPKRVASISRRLAKAGAEARAMGLLVFGGSGTGSLRWFEERGDIRSGGVVVSEFGGGIWDGGDGATHHDMHGLLRGEDG